MFFSPLQVEVQWLWFPRGPGWWGEAEWEGQAAGDGELAGLGCGPELGDTVGMDGV